MKKTALVLFSILLMAGGAAAQQKANYDEDKVPLYSLPSLLECNNGDKVRSIRKWEKTRRKELLKIFHDEEYGYFPGGKVKMKTEVVEQSDEAVGGKAVRKQLELTFSREGKSHTARMIVYLPKNVRKAPVFLSLNFKGNHGISSADTAIIVSNGNPRGMNERRWPLEKIIDAGYGVATAWYYDFFPDEKDGAAESIYKLFSSYDVLSPGPTDGKAIAAWAWGLSRMMDCLSKMPRVDSKRVIVMGHSRLGKTSLWAGACDKRFAIVISNESGCGGAALSKREFGETLNAINTTFPHWFCGNFNKYNNNEGALKFDQHELIALAAPRPVYVGTAQKDEWSDPYGQYLSSFHASPVYELYGYSGLSSETMPPLNSPVQGRIGFHIREGVHDVTDFDWDNYIAFANLWLGNPRGTSRQDQR